MLKSEAECNPKKNGTCFSRLSAETRLSVSMELISEQQQSPAGAVLTP